MGALKHVILPAFGLLHGMSLYACRDVKSWSELVGIKEDNNLTSQTNQHMLAVLRGFNIAMGILCVVGISCEGHKFRGKLALAESALFVTVSIDAYRQGLNYKIPSFQAILAMVGVIINQMEPGIFTKAKPCCQKKE